MHNSEKQKLVFDAKLSEYRELRTELRMNMQLQWSILAAFLALFGVLFVILFKRTDGNGTDLMNPLVISCVGYFVLPALGAATGILWLDQVLRQMRIVNYIYQIEDQVAEILGKSSTDKVMYWEHEVKKDNTEKAHHRLSKFFNPNFFNYYAVLGIMFLFPIFSFVLTLKISNASKPHPIWLIFFVIVYAFFGMMACSQIIAISKHSPSKN